MFNKAKWGGSTTTHFLGMIIPTTDLDTWFYNQMLRVCSPLNGGSAWFPPFFQNNGLLKLAKMIPPSWPLRLGVFVLLIIGLLLWCSKGRFRCRKLSVSELSKLSGQFCGTAIVVWEMGVVEGFLGCFGMSFGLVFLKGIVCVLKKIQLKWDMFTEKRDFRGFCFLILWMFPKWKWNSYLKSPKRWSERNDDFFLTSCFHQRIVKFSSKRGEHVARKGVFM